MGLGSGKSITQSTDVSDATGRLPIANLAGSSTSNGLMLRNNNGVVSYGSSNINLKLIGKHYQFGTDVSTNSANTGNDTGCTSRLRYTTTGAVSVLQLFVRGTRGNTGTGVETVNPNPVIQRATIEYPVGVAYAQFSVGGKTTWVLDGSSPGSLTDPLGISLPNATNFNIRFYQRTSTPPTSVSGSAAAGGSLAANTYYYKVTAIDNGIESNPCAEFTVTTATTNLTAALTWTANTNAENYRIYRSTTTNTNVLVAEVPAPSTGWNDTGAGQIVSTATPPATTLSAIYSRSGIFTSAESCNPKYVAYAGTDQTLSVAAITGISGTNTQPTAASFVVLGDDVASNPILGLGDSMQAGTGIEPGSGTTGTYMEIGNWFDLGLAAVGGKNSLNVSIPGAKAKDFATPAGNNLTRSRMALSRYADIIVSNLGTNDININADIWQNIALYHIQIGRGFKAAGKKYYNTTLCPCTSSTNNWLTVGAQTIVPTNSRNTIRTNYNTWTRNGRLVDGSGTPVLTDGTPTPHIDGYFDMAAGVEVNTSNVLTANGGYWRVATEAVITAQTLTGTPTATSLAVSGTPYGVSNLKNKVVKITSGIADGQTALISANTSSAITLYANGVSAFSGVGTYTGLTSVPSAGDTFEIWENYSMDSVHFSQVGSALTGGLFSTFATANFSAF